MHSAILCDRKLAPKLKAQYELIYKPFLKDAAWNLSRKNSILNNWLFPLKNSELKIAPLIRGAEALVLAEELSKYYHPNCIQSLETIKQDYLSTVFTPEDVHNCNS